MVRRSFVLFLLALFVAIVGKGWHWAKDGFALGRILQPLFVKPVAKLPSMPDSLRKHLDQPFFYLGRGHQNYAFLSQDKEIVLKVPRYDIYKPPFWLRSLPFLRSYREAYLQEKQRRLDFFLGSFFIAFEEMQEETALLFLHLAKTEDLKTQVALIDRVGRRFAIDLDQTGFLLQRRCDLLIPAYLEALDFGDRKKREELLMAFLTFNAHRASKGIHNKDPSFMRNFAIEGERVVQIDVGSFYKQEEQDFRTSCLKLAGHLADFLKEMDPEIVDWFQKRAEELACQKSS